MPIAKPFFFDCETTGTDPRKSDIVQMSFEYNGDVKTLYCRPTRLDGIEEEALKVTGLTIDEIMAYPEPQEAMIQLLDFLDNHHGRYNSASQPKAIFIAHNARFDWDFFWDFFYRYVSRTQPNPDKPGEFLPDVNLGNYFIKSPLCTLSSYATAVATGKLDRPKGFNQTALLELHGMKNEKAHDAECDMLGMRQLFYKVLCPTMNWPWVEPGLRTHSVCIPTLEQLEAARI